MTTFDELIGAEPTGAERARLRSVHELILEAGPPPELAPDIESGPTIAMTFSRLRLISKRRRMPILSVAAAVIVALVITIGATIHSHGTGYPTIAMRGASIGSGAVGRLELLPKRRMQLEVHGLPALKEKYVVYLIRAGRERASCGSFTVSKPNREKTVSLRTPYAVKSTDTWDVTVQTPTGEIVVLKPVT